MLRKGIEILILSFNYFKLSISLNNVCGFFCVDLGYNSHTLIALVNPLIALAHTLIALTNLNSSEKLHQLNLGLYIKPDMCLLTNVQPGQNSMTIRERERRDI